MSDVEKEQLPSFTGQGQAVFSSESCTLSKNWALLKGCNGQLILSRRKYWLKKSRCQYFSLEKNTFLSFSKQVKSWVRFHLNIFLEPISEMNHLLPLLKSPHCLLSLSPFTALQVTWAWMWLYTFPISKRRGSLFIYSTNIFWKPIF